MRLDVVVPGIICIESLIACGVYLCFKEYNKALYWFASAVIVITVLNFKT